MAFGRRPDHLPWRRFIGPKINGSRLYAVYPQIAQIYADIEGKGMLLVADISFLYPECYRG